MPRKASSCGLGRPWGRNPCGLPWVSGVVHPTVVELSFLDVIFNFSELFASFDVFASCNLFTGKLYAGSEVVWRCGVILFFCFSD